MKNKNLLRITNMQWLFKIGDSMDSKLSLQNHISTGNAEKSEIILTSRRKPKIHLYGLVSGIY